MIQYPRTTSSTSSGVFDDDEPMNPYQTPPLSPADHVPEVLQRHMVRMFSAEDASGTSAVAIDNKIEQAMDLVKSHLMIAVREEVEVLKEKISELMDKINQLEVENTILKANMPQETLQQLQMQTQLQIAGTSVNTPAATTAVATNNMITPTPTPAPVQQLQPPATPTASAAESDANTNATAVVAATAAAAVTTSVTSGNTNVDTATATINGPLPSS